jgi:adenylate kinase
MAHTQADLDTIKAAIASGEHLIEIAGRKVMYRSIDELRKARDDIAAELASTATASTSSVRRGSYQVRFSTARGY